MVDVTQSDNTLLAHAELTHPAYVEGTAVSVASWFAGMVYVYMAAIEAVSTGDDPPFILIQVSYDASGDDNWVPTNLRFALDANVTPALANLTATEPVDETTIALDDTTGLETEDKVYIEDTTTLADSEWHMLARVNAGTDVELLSGLRVEKDSADDLHDACLIEAALLDLTGVERVRAVLVHEGATGPDLHYKCLLKAATDIE